MSDNQERIIVTTLLMLVMFSQFHAYRSFRLHPLELGVVTHERVLAREEASPLSYRLLYPQLVERIADALR